MISVANPGNIMYGINLLMSVPDNRFLFWRVVNARSSFYGNIPRINSTDSGLLSILWCCRPFPQKIPQSVTGCLFCRIAHCTTGLQSVASNSGRDRRRWWEKQMTAFQTFYTVLPPRRDVQPAVRLHSFRRCNWPVRPANSFRGFQRYKTCHL